MSKLAAATVSSYPGVHGIFREEQSLPSKTLLLVSRSSLFLQREGFFRKKYYCLMHCANSVTRHFGSDDAIICPECLDACPSYECILHQVIPQTPNLGETKKLAIIVYNCNGIR